jgi:hypothetical protein
MIKPRNLLVMLTLNDSDEACPTASAAAELTFEDVGIRYSWVRASITFESYLDELDSLELGETIPCLYISSPQ